MKTPDSLKVRFECTILDHSLHSTNGPVRSLNIAAFSFRVNDTEDSSNIKYAPSVKIKGPTPIDSDNFNNILESVVNIVGSNTEIGPPATGVCYAFTDGNVLYCITPNIETSENTFPVPIILLQGLTIMLECLGDTYSLAIPSNKDFTNFLQQTLIAGYLEFTKQA